MAKSNVGQTGVDSIRLRGLPVEDLPLGTGNEAAAQMADAREMERLNAIATVAAEYPHQRIDYLSSRINECEQNKNRMRQQISHTLGQINEYKGHIMKCDVRDKMLADIPEDDTAARREVYKQWGRYDKDALEQQIVQFEEAIERFEAVVDQEDASIKEHTEVITLCRERDRKLAELGAKSEGS